MTTPLVNASGHERSDAAADGDVRSGWGRWRPSAHPTRWVVGSTIVLATLPRVLTALAHFRTVDELVWLERSRQFAEALGDGRFGDASARSASSSTMPGVTTMWIGAAADTMWSWGDRLGLVDPAQQSVARGVYPTLELGQVLMAVVSGALVGVIALLVVRWCGLVAGAVTGVLVATEPFAVAHGAVLHTDELVALFGVGASLAAALALGVPRATPWAGRRSMAALAGLLMAGAVLTKLTGLVFLPGIALLAGWAVVAATRRDAADGEAADGHVPVDAGRGRHEPGDYQPGGEHGPVARPDLRRIARMAGVGAAVMAVAVVAAYPALWIDPLREVRAIRRSAGLGSTGHLQFFRGHVTEDPGATFYPVTLAFRVTPWLLVAGVVAGAAIWLSRRTRGHAAVLACIGVPAFVALTMATKKFDRYGLALVVLLAVVVAVVVDDLVVGARRGRWSSGASARVAVGTSLLAAAVLVAWSVVLAPWGLAYYNPLLGGSERAQRTVLVGWGEGIDQALDLIAEREAGRCEEVTVSGSQTFDPLPCGRVANDLSADYVLVYVNGRQRQPRSWLRAQTEGRELVGVVEERGIRYVEVWR